MSPFLIAMTLPAPLAELPSSDRLVEDFNKAKGKVRVVMLVSPT
ncbi:MAG: hypothetical protein ACR2HJ_08980 [Fimbriimonadales bacterium]